MEMKGLAFDRLPNKVRSYVAQCADLCRPDQVHICDGSDEENQQLLTLMQSTGMLKPLPRYENCWLARTDPADVARVESKTFISTRDKYETVPHVASGAKGYLGLWMSPDKMDEELRSRFPGCMQGRTMYVIPYSMGPVGSPLSKIGIEVTDSPYVVSSMRIMTRIGSQVLDSLGEDEFVKCLHSVGKPLEKGAAQKGETEAWPCNPEKTLIAHIPERNEICSYGSGYGGNSLLGKKCFALRIGSILAKREGWLAEHMLILGITNPQGKKIYVTAAFPSACGKTNLAMLVPTLPNYKVECVGDDIAWLKFDENGVLRAINPEAGFFGVAPGTSDKTNPNAMKTINRNTVFTNVAETPDGGFWWEGLDKEIPIEEVTDWRGKKWTPGSKGPAAHPNSRFCAPADQCPVIDPKWEDPEGVPISAIIFGGRRPEGVPLIYESFNWEHGVFVGSAMRSEATAAAEHKGKDMMHDPFAMRPFFGYNFGDYLRHWLSFGQHKSYKLPRIYHVNWFRKDSKGKFIWPGFGENCRVLDWIVRRCNGEDSAMETPIGYIPKPDAINIDGLKDDVDMQELFRIPTDFWIKEADAVDKFYKEQVGEDIPQEMEQQLASLRQRLDKSVK